MRDIDDRVAELQIEPVHEHLLRILDTSPGARRRWRLRHEARAASWRARRSCCWRGRRAGAEYRGSDLLGNVAPESQVQGGLADSYPLSAYALDYHVDVGVTEPEGIPPMIAQWAAAQLWSATSLLVKCTIDLFTWAFSLDLLNGSDGALAPIGDAITDLYENVIGEAWMVAAILVAGIWGIWKALVQRRYTETAGALARLGGVRADRAVLRLPARTHRRAGRAVDQHALAARSSSGANRGSLDDPEQAKRQVSDHLFETLLVQPWVVLQFGGLAHCVDTDQLDDDGFPRPVGPHDPARDVCRDHLTARPRRPRRLRAALPAPAPGLRGTQGRVRRAPRGRDPVPDPTAGSSAGYKVDKADAPAVDAQQAGGAYQRLTFSVDRAARRARRGRAARLPVAGRDPRPGRRARAARLRAGRADHRHLPRRRARVLPRLAVQARHRDLHQGPLLARDRDRRRRLRRADRQHRLARLPVRLRAADDLLLGDLHLPQADHQPARRRDHRQRRRAVPCRA